MMLISAGSNKIVNTAFLAFMKSRPALLHSGRTFLLAICLIDIVVTFQIAKPQGEQYSGRRFLRQFALPDYPINVTISQTEPAYYCLVFEGRPGIGLSAEGCAGLSELKARGQHFWRVLIGNSDSHPAVVVDVGANIGSHFSYPAALGAKIYAIEPHPYHARRLLHMSHLNEWDATVFAGAADDRDGDGIIYMLEGGHLVMRNVEHVSESSLRISRTYNIGLVRLDSLVQESSKILMIKFDTDGHELQALEGSRRLFEHGPGVKYMKVEFVPLALRKGNSDDPTAPLRTLQLLRQFGFQLYLIHWRGLLEGEYFCVHDLSLMYEEKDEKFISEFLARPGDGYAGTNLLAVNKSDVNDIAFDFPCLAPWEDV